MSKAKKKLSKAQVRIASETLGKMFATGEVRKTERTSLLASAMEAAEAIVASLKVVSKASRNK